MASITINGCVFEGDSIVVEGGEVIIDGKPVDVPVAKDGVSICVYSPDTMEEVFLPLGSKTKGMLPPPETGE